MSTFETIIAKLNEWRGYWRYYDAQIYARQQSIALFTARMEERIRQNKIVSPIESEPEWETVKTLLDNIETFENNIRSINLTLTTTEKQLDELGHAREIMAEHWDADTPILLFPLRIHSRFVRVKHLAKVGRENILDLSGLNEAGASASIGSETAQGMTAEKGSWSETVANEVFTRSRIKNNPILTYEIEQKLLQSEDRHWYKKMEDAFELWVRIYPDDIFVHGHEEYLSFAEIRAGQAFWIRYWDIQKESIGLKNEEKNKMLVDAWKKLQDAYLPAKAAWIYKLTKPSNFPPPNLDYSQKPEFSNDIKIRTGDWTRPLRSYVLPDRFSVCLFKSAKSDVPEKEITGKRIVYPLALSQDPLQENAEEIPEEIRWITDFDEAEKIGMGIRIPISKAEYEQGFDRLVVLGLNLSLDPQGGKESVEKLLTNHQYKHGGLSLLPQGTATNNFGNESSGYSLEGPSPADVFQAIHYGINKRKVSNWKKTDTHYLSELLGLDFDLFKYLYNAGSRDIMGARAMNHLLWPGTLGYYFSQFFHTILSKEDIARTRTFFASFVSGMGSLPAIQIGRQPYGILATTAYSQLHQTGSFLDGRPFEKALFNNIIRPLNDYWGELLQHVRYIGDGTVLHKYAPEFQDLIDFNASTETLFYRPIVGRFLLRNLFRYHNPELEKEYLKGWQNLDDLFEKEAKDNYMPDWIPEELDKLFDGLFSRKFGGDFRKARIFQHHLYQFYGGTSKSLVDPRGPSESRKLPPLEGKKFNYLQHLARATPSSLQNEFRSSDPLPVDRNTFFYAIARQAISWEYLDLMFELRGQHPIITFDFEKHLTQSSTNALGLDYEQRNYIQEVFKETLTTTAGREKEREISAYYRNNKWEYFLDIDGIEIEKWIEKEANKLFNMDPKARSLARSKSALRALGEYSTASLQRLFTEHIDLCSHRLDAWMQGFVNQQLRELRKKDGKTTGLYLGAYGYLERVRPGNELGISFRVVQKPQLITHNNATDSKPSNTVIPILDFNSFERVGLDISKILNHAWVYLGSDFYYETEPNPNQPEILAAKPIEAAPDNQGFLQTPSQLHAITAAILRSGYQANRSEEFYEPFAVNLSSARIRKALYLIRGVQSGQQLSALLGYQFERYLHDNAGGPLDEYILNFRKQFPLYVYPGYNDDLDSPDEYQAAYSTLDGFKLMEYFRQLIADELTDTDKKKIETDFGLAEEDVASIVAAMWELLSNVDAVSDLLLAESVYQVAKGDLEASANALKMMNNESEADIPEIIDTPQQNQLLSHVVGIYFDDRKNARPWTKIPSPRSVVNPILNNWLTRQLPAPHRICINLLSEDRPVRKIKLKELDLHPIDFIYLFKGRNAFSEISELSKIIKTYLQEKWPTEAIENVRIDFQDRSRFSKTQVCIYDILPLIEVLNQLLAQSRPLLPSDLQRETQTEVEGKGAMPTIDNTELLKAFKSLKQFGKPYELETQLNQIASQQDPYEQWGTISKLSESLFGKDFLIFPEFKLANQVEMELAYKANILEKNESPLLLDEWFQGVAQVRKNLKNFQRLKQMRTLLKVGADDQKFTVTQLPYQEEHYYWLGAEYPDEVQLMRDNLSVSMELPENFRTNKKLAGMVIDKWKEVLPERHKTSAVAMNYNQPNVEPPQTILLSVSPKKAGNWEWSDLLQSIVDTMDLAKKRAIDQDIIAKGLEEQKVGGVQKNVLRYLLPGIVAPVCLNGDTPWVDFSK